MSNMDTRHHSPGGLVEPPTLFSDYQQKKRGSPCCKQQTVVKLTIASLCPLWGVATGWKEER